MNIGSHLDDIQMQEKLYYSDFSLSFHGEISALLDLRYDVSLLEDFMRNFCATFDISTENVLL